jgi:hypothetical protein
MAHSGQRCGQEKRLVEAWLRSPRNFVRRCSSGSCSVQRVSSIWYSRHLKACRRTVATCSVMDSTGRFAAPVSAASICAHSATASRPRLSWRARRSRRSNTSRTLEPTDQPEGLQPLVLQHEERLSSSPLADTRRKFWTLFGQFRPIRRECRKWLWRGSS